MKTTLSAFSTLRAVAVTRFISLSREFAGKPPLYTKKSQRNWKLYQTMLTELEELAK